MSCSIVNERQNLIHFTLKGRGRFVKSNLFHLPENECKTALFPQDALLQECLELLYWEHHWRCVDELLHGPVVLPNNTQWNKHLMRPLSHLLGLLGDSTISSSILKEQQQGQSSIVVSQVGPARGCRTLWTTKAMETSIGDKWKEGRKERRKERTWCTMLLVDLLATQVKKWQKTRWIIFYTFWVRKPVQVELLLSRILMRCEKLLIASAWKNARFLYKNYPLFKWCRCSMHCVICAKL